LFFLVSVPHDLLILGASARAAASSALRCGIVPRCADYFADLDLAAIAAVHRINPRDSAREFAARAQAIPPSPWLYTGGLENHPDLVEHISRRHRLWGVDGQSLRRVRDPIAVADLFDQAAIPHPQVRLEPEGLPRDGRWLVKPRKSGGGREITPLTVGNGEHSSSCYYQERIDGPSFSALYLADRTRARLMGTTRQLIGFPGCPFGYRGSIGPWQESPTLAARLHRIGDWLASSLGLVGCFGVDYVMCDEIPWPVEVNPRYTASVEVHELATGRSVMAEHRRVCEGGTLEADREPPPAAAPRAWVAKLIVHAPNRLLAPEIPLGENERDGPIRVPAIADVPAAGTRFEPGDPIATLLSAGATAGECWSRMLRLERAFQNRLGLAATEWTDVAF
jgi:uncharacterized protein